MMRSGYLRSRDSGARGEVLSLMERALSAVSPSRLVRSLVAREADALNIAEDRYPLGGRRVLLFGAGKAAPSLARELELILGDTLEAGIVVTRHGHALQTVRVRVVEGGHPLPDADGVAGASALLALAQSARDGDLALCVFSGGGSSLLSLPSPGIELADLRALNEVLLRSGAPIDILNVVRRHVTPLLGGGLARVLAPAQVVTLLLSDVVGDHVETIASGPTVPDPTTFADAREALSRHGIWEEVPPSVRERISRGVRGLAPETPKPGDLAFTRTSTYILGTNRTAVDAAAKEGARRGWSVKVLDEPMVGEARAVGERLARAARDLAERSERALIVAGGETTVTVRGPGRGGRNQEVALAAALAVEGIPHVVVAALATDGTDGPTDAAGGIVDGETAARVRSAGVDPGNALETNDSYAALAAAGGLLLTGPTGTNVADVFFVLHDPGL